MFAIGAYSSAVLERNNQTNFEDCTQQTAAHQFVGLAFVIGQALITHARVHTHARTRTHAIGSVCNCTPRLSPLQTIFGN